MVCGFLSAVVFLLWNTGSTALRLSDCDASLVAVACGISVGQGLNLCPLHWQVYS